MQRLLCIYTGGTIGCLPTANGLAPAAGVLLKPLSDLAAQLPDAPALEWLEYPEPLDSSSMGPQHWNRIGADIASSHDDFDGFVVLHGTDTLAYTAAALSFQLEHLGKPVLLTGSQRPWLAAASDAPSNVALAIKNALGGWAGVRVAFGGRLLPGPCIRKTEADQDRAFTAPNWNGIWASSAHPTQTARCVEIDPQARILAIKLYPGFSVDWLCSALAHPVQGLVLETFGSGNLPDHPALLAALQQQNAAGAIIINCSQCHAGKVRQGRYAASHVLEQTGVIAAGDMTTEAAVTKLYYLIASRGSHAAVRADFCRNLRGEISEDLC